MPRSENEVKETEVLRTAHKVLNVNITTVDDVRLGAWFIHSDPFYTSSYSITSPSSSPSSVISTASISSAMKLFPTVLFFHGNAGTRAVSLRVATYASYTARLGANVLAVDYRGFGDSEGTPSEAGLNRDARAAWDWAIGNGADPEDVVLVGQSLGTGVVAQLAQELAVEGVTAPSLSIWCDLSVRIGTKPRGVVLISPFSSMAALLETYNICGWIPLLKPLQIIPFAQRENSIACMRAGVDNLMPRIYIAVP